MKIIYCIGATYNSGGMERVLANKANYLVLHGYEVVIVTTDQSGKKPFFPLSKEIRQYDLNINYSKNNNKGFLNKLLSFPFKQQKHKIELSKFLKKEKAEIVISMFDSEVSFLWKIKDGSRKIVEIHFSRYKRLQYMRRGAWGVIDRFRTCQDASFASKYDRFVVLTKEDSEYWGKMPNIEVIPNANTFKNKKEAPLMEKQAIAIGRLEYQKGFEDMIYSWKFIKDKFPDWHLKIYGDGKLKEKLIDLIQTLSLEKEVFIEDTVSNIQDKYMESSVLLMTSRYEGLPMTLLEAQCCGLPIVSYSCKCGPQDVVEEGINGFLVPEGNVAYFADKVKEIINNNVLRKRMGHNSLRMSANYDEEKIMEKWENLFRELTNYISVPLKSQNAL